MRRPLIFIICLISLAAGWSLWYVTPAGLGLTNDSAAYVGGARSILAGTGYSDVWLDSSLEAITHYPPLLSLILSGLGLFGLDPYRGARVLHIFLFAANTGLIGLLGWRMTHSQPAGIFLALLFGLNAQILKIHAYLLSEPLFIFFSLLSFLFFDLALVTNHSSRATRHLFLLTGFLTGLACLTRYSGLALLATFLLSLVLFQPDWRSRFVKIAQFLGGALPPLAVWFIRNKLVAGNATNRTFQFHPILLENIRVGLWNFYQFLLPLDYKGHLFKGFATNILVITGLLLLCFLGFRTYRVFAHPKTERSMGLSFTTGLYVFAYLGAILFSMSFFDASTKFQPRILAPLYISWMILCVALLNWLGHIPISKIVDAQIGKFKAGALINTLFRFTLLLIAFCIMLLLSFDYGSTVDYFHQVGQGYASWKWRDSLVMADLKKLPADVAIYTNTPPAVYLVVGRASRVIPTAMDPVDNRPRGDYQQNLEQMRADLLAGRAVLALFDTSGIEDALGTDTVENFTAGLTVLEKAQGDLLYGKP